MAQQRRSSDIPRRRGKASDALDEVKLALALALEEEAQMQAAKRAEGEAPPAVSSHSPRTTPGLKLTPLLLHPQQQQRSSATPSPTVSRGGGAAASTPSSSSGFGKACHLLLAGSSGGQPEFPLAPCLSLGDTAAAPPHDARSVALVGLSAAAADVGSYDTLIWAVEAARADRRQRDDAFAAASELNWAAFEARGEQSDNVEAFWSALTEGDRRVAQLERTRKLEALAVSRRANTLEKAFRDRMTIIQLRGEEKQRAALDAAAMRRVIDVKSYFSVRGQQIHSGEDADRLRTMGMQHTAFNQIVAERDLKIGVPVMAATGRGGGGGQPPLGGHHTVGSNTVGATAAVASNPMPMRTAAATPSSSSSSPSPPATAATGPSQQPSLPPPPPRIPVPAAASAVAVRRATATPRSSSPSSGSSGSHRTAASAATPPQEAAPPKLSQKLPAIG